MQIWQIYFYEIDGALHDAKVLNGCFVGDSLLNLPREILMDVLFKPLYDDFLGAYLLSYGGHALRVVPDQVIDLHVLVLQQLGLLVKQLDHGLALLDEHFLSSPDCL